MIKNKNFNVGEKYIGIVNEEIFEVENIKEDSYGRKIVCFKSEKNGKKYERYYRHAQELLLKKL